MEPKSTQTAIYLIALFLLFILIKKLNSKTRKMELSNLYIFKVANSGKFYYKNRQEKAGDDDYYYGNVTAQDVLEQDFIEGIFFFSNEKDLSFIKYSIFLSGEISFRTKELFSNHDKITNYFLQKYGINFFFNREIEERISDPKKKCYYLIHKLTYEDFKKIILPNINISFLEKVNPKIKNDKKYIIFNWDFYNQLNTSPYPSNSLYTWLWSDFPIPFESDSKMTLIIQGFNTIQYTSGFTDSMLKGNMFSIELSKKLKKVNIPLCSFQAINFLNKDYYYMTPTNQQISLLYKDNEKKLSTDFDKLTNIMKYNLLPFVIIEEGKIVNNYK